MNEKLELWEPLTENPFCNLKNQLHFYDMSCLHNFILVFEEAGSSRLYVFIYENLKKDTAVISFRFYPLLTRSDFDQLAINFWKEREETGAHSLSYEPMFFKVCYSSWISGYDSIFPARVQLNPEAEHHAYVTSDYYIEVMSEQEPIVRIMEKEEWKKIRNSLLDVM
ncbi:hypothetical protein [Sporosarcina sp. NPDC096371]|uniref:hypothetical protein n=1 Tax=Sporosarcina sp. NPDC096371 TaxID=3364530 RepID=UPI0038136C05